MNLYFVWTAILFKSFTQLVFSLEPMSSDEGWFSPGWFWHVTDIHYDPTYNERQLSCSVEVNNSGEYGNYKCDSPWVLVDSSINAMAEIKQNVDFIIWNGDTVLHAPDEELSDQTNIDILTKVTNALKEAFPGTPVYANFGNHDYHPSDQFPPHNNYLYDAMLSEWRCWSDKEQDNNFKKADEIAEYPDMNIEVAALTVSEKSSMYIFICGTKRATANISAICILIFKGGYYTVKTRHGIRIVAVNTNLYYIPNRQVLNETDPAGQFKWLNETLAHAREKQEKVLVATHIPPGMSNTPGKLSMHDNYHSFLVSILQKYTDTITGIHCGHDHADKIKLLADITGKLAVPIFIAPSVTPAVDHNPAIRLVKYNRKTGTHLDIEQYYLDLQKANNSSKIMWENEYRSSDVFNIEDLTASSLEGLMDRMKDIDSEDFKHYRKFRRVSYIDSYHEYCDSKCHASMICEITHINVDEFNQCVQGSLTAGSSYSTKSTILTISVQAVFILTQV